MALAKNLVSREGYTTTYHRIDSVNLTSGNELTCHLDSYVSKEYRNLKRPAQSHFFYFTITIEEEESMGIRQLAYKKIKELPDWADAEDC